MTEDTRTRILDAAETRFAQRGYRGTALADIAHDVGVRVPSLYKHVDGKQALFDAVMARLFAPYTEMLFELLETPEGPERSEHNLITVVDYYTRNPNLARLLVHTALSGEEEVDALMERYLAPVFERAIELTESTPAVMGDPIGVARAVVAFHSLIAGYVAMAPIHARVMGEDPLSEPALEAFGENLRALVRALWPRGAG